MDLLSFAVLASQKTPASADAVVLSVCTFLQSSGIPRQVAIFAASVVLVITPHHVQTSRSCVHGTQRCHWLFLAMSCNTACNIRFPSAAAVSSQARSMNLRRNALYRCTNAQNWLDEETKPPIVTPTSLQPAPVNLTQQPGSVFFT